MVRLLLMLVAALFALSGCARFMADYECSKESKGNIREYQDCMIERGHLDAEKVGLQRMTKAERKRYKEEKWCKAQVKDEEFPNVEECLFALDNPVEYECLSLVKDAAFPSMDDCKYAAEHPLEYRCQQEVKKVGGSVWECMRFYEERERWAQSQRQRQAEIEAAQEQRNAEIWAESIRQAGEAFKPKATCTSRPDGLGGVSTVCH